jgi:hypothetical protein
MAFFNPRAFLWQNGMTADLRTPAFNRESGVSAAVLSSMNAVAEIVGWGGTTNGLHGFSGAEAPRRGWLGVTMKPLIGYGSNVTVSCSA